MGRIKALGVDVDGTLTDGGVYVDAVGNETVKFNRRDGHGIKLLKEAGITVFAISAENSESTKRRMIKMNIPYYSGVKNKVEFTEQVLREMGISWNELAFIGDDINDLEVMKKCGFCACPKDAEQEVIGIAKYYCDRLGGHGAVREFINLLLKDKI